MLFKGKWKRALFVFLVGVICCLFFIIPRSDLIVSTKISPKNISAGARAEYVLTINHSDRYEIKDPDISEIEKDFDVFNITKSTKQLFGRSIDTYRVSLTQYMPGKYLIPSIPIPYRDHEKHHWNKFQTKNEYLHIKRLLDPKSFERHQVRFASIAADMKYEDGREYHGSQGHDVDLPIAFPIKDIRGPYEFVTWKTVFRYCAIVIIPLLLLGTICVIALSYFSGITVVDQVFEETVARKKLRELRDSDIYENEGVSSFAGKALNILKEFLVKRYELSMDNPTSDELLAAVSDVNEISDDDKHSIAARIGVLRAVSYSQVLDQIEGVDRQLLRELELVDKNKKDRGVEE